MASVHTMYGLLSLLPLSLFLQGLYFALDDATGRKGFQVSANCLLSYVNLDVALLVLRLL